MTKLQLLIQEYWRVSHAVRHPEGESITVAEANRSLNSCVHILPLRCTRLCDNLYILRHDIVEGNTKWRQNEHVTDFKLIPFMTK